MVEFCESGMNFSFDEKKTYHIEKSELYEKIKGKGVACVECIVLHKKYMCFIEAKSSVPVTKDSDKEKFWNQIRKKDVDSFLMFSRQVLEEKSLDIGEELRKAYFNKPSIRFVLIINGRTLEECQALTFYYRKKLSDISAIYNAEVVVMNEVMATKQSLVELNK